MEPDEIEEYKCKFCDNKIIAGYRCVDCYINKIDKISAKPYKDEDFMKEHEAPDAFDPFKGLKIPDPLQLPGYPYIPLTGTGTTTGDLPYPFDTRPDTSAGTEINIVPEQTYNPWFRNTWHKQYDTSTGSTTVDFSSGTNAQNL